jgi:tetratricopeptide (TPR) repeat protein
MVVEEESAVLGLTGLRETQLVLDADHKGICKIGSRGHMYNMVKGNIRSLVDQALVTSQGYVPPPTMHPTPPSVPPRFPSNRSSSNPGAQADDPTRKVTGVMYPATGQDQRALRLAEHKNMGRWDQVKLLEQQIFQEHQRTLGPEHLTTLMAGHDLAVTELELGYVQDADKWCKWVSSTSQSTLGPDHRLSMQAESLGGEILLEKCQYQEAEASCANVFAHQQDNLGDDHLDTLETQRRLAHACNGLDRRQDALTRLQRRSETLSRLLGEDHIQVYASALDLVQIKISPSAKGAAGHTVMTRFNSEFQQASKIMPPIYQDLRGSLGAKHPLTIRALRICGTIKILEGQNTEALDTLRRALSNAEAALGRDSPETMLIVVEISRIYCQQDGGFGFPGTPSAEARPWLQRYADWGCIRRGLNDPEVRTVLNMLGMSWMAGKNYAEAEKCYEQLSIGYQGENSEEAQKANNMLQACKGNRMLTEFRGLTNGTNVADFLSSWRS